MSSTEKRANILEKLAIKDKMAVNRARQSLLLVEEEISQKEQMKTQLETLLEEHKQKEIQHNSQSLHSASWFNTKIRDQLEMIEAGLKQLRVEKDRLTAELVIAEQKRTRKQDRADELKTIARAERQARADQQTAELVASRRR